MCFKIFKKHNSYNKNLMFYFKVYDTLNAILFISIHNLMPIDPVDQKFLEKWVSLQICHKLNFFKKEF